MIEKALKRRGMMGALAALGALASKGVDAHSVNALGSVNRIGSATLSSADCHVEEFYKKWDLFRRQNERGERRAELQRMLMNGWPAPYDSQHSNAPWFRAMCAARKIEGEQYERQDWWTKMRDQFFGRLKI